jgi:hypothetical protein
LDFSGETAFDGGNNAQSGARMTGEASKSPFDDPRLTAILSLWPALIEDVRDELYRMAVQSAGVGIVES